MVPCWDCKMLKKLGVKVGPCTGGTCKALEKISLSEAQWAELISASERSLEDSPARLAKVHEMEHKRLLRFARRNADCAATK
jgi:hypothetical protein